MWTALVLVGMLSLFASEGMASASDETGVRVLQVRNTRSRQECSQQCKEALGPDGVRCNWPTVYLQRCLLVHCRSLPLCRRLKGGDIAELLAGFKDFTKRKKRDDQAVFYLKRRAENSSNATNGTVTSATMPTTSPTTVLVTQATLVPLTERSSTTNRPLTATSTAPESTTSLSTKVTMLAPTNTTPQETIGIKTALTTIQTSTRSRETTLVTKPAVVSSHPNSNSSQLTMFLTPITTHATPASKVTAEATTVTSLLTTKSTEGTSSSTTKPSQPTSPQIFSVPSQPEPAGFTASTVNSATLRGADNSTVKSDLTTVIPNAINTYTTELQSQTSNLETINTKQLAKNDSVINSTTDPLLVSVTGQTFNIKTEATTTVSEIISVEMSSSLPSLITKVTPKPSLLPTTTHKETVPIKTEEPLTYTTTPKKETTMPKTTLPTLQHTPRTGSTNFTSQSSTSIPGGSQNDVNSDKYLIATWPLARHLMDTSSLLAVLLFGIVFFLAVVFVFASQAYESYKKKDYTQVDYLINGMYTDSEL